MSKKSPDVRDYVNTGWVSLHRLSAQLSASVESCGNRDTVSQSLQGAVWAHLNVYQTIQLANKLKESATPRCISELFTLEMAFADVSLLFFGLLSSLGGQQHNLWTRQYRVDNRTETAVETYRLVCFGRTDGQVAHSFATRHTQQAVRLAAAWATYLVNPEKDVKLLAVLESGAVVNCPTRKAKAEGKGARS
jgi:hypothetical protein